MKGRWESIMNVWFPFMYSRKWNCYFQNRIIMFCLTVPTLIYLWEVYIFPGWSAYSATGKYADWYKSLSDTWMWKLGLRPCNSQERNTWDFPCSVYLLVPFFLYSILILCQLLAYIAFSVQLSVCLLAQCSLHLQYLSASMYICRVGWL